MLPETIEPRKLEANRRAKNLKIAALLTGSLTFLLYPLLIAADRSLVPLVLCHLTSPTAYLLAVRGRATLGAWIACGVTAVVMLEAYTHTPEDFGTLYYLTLPVTYAAATMRSSHVRAYTFLVVIGLFSLFFWPGFRVENTMHLFSASLVVGIGGVVVSLAAGSSERNVEEMIEALDAQRLATERAIVEAEMREAAELAAAKVEATNLAKSSFLTAMSHELRTPLNAILGYAELIAEEIEEVAPESLPDLERIQTSAVHLRRLIDDILDLSKVEAGKIQIELSEIELEPVLVDVERATAPLFSRRKNRFRVRCDAASVVADRTRLLQVLLNLVGNSAKFTEQGQVDLFVEPHAGGVLFRVQDTGCGMTPEQLAHAFEPFRQVKTSLHPEGGSGLGLALARQLAEAMGGTLVGSSVFGEGTEMTLWLPDVSK